MHSRPSRASAPMLASFLTVVYGLIAAAFALTLASDAPLEHMMYVCVAAMACVAIIWLMRRVAPNASADLQTWILGNRQEDPLAGYSAARKGRRVRHYGDQKPPTLEDIRDIKAKANANVWVPSKASGDS